MEENKEEISLEELIEKEVRSFSFASCGCRNFCRPSSETPVLFVWKIFFYIVLLYCFQRAALSSQNLTKVTLESFLKWKQKKVSVLISENSSKFVALSYCFVHAFHWHTVDLFSRFVMLTWLVCSHSERRKEKKGRGCQETKEIRLQARKDSGCKLNDSKNTWVVFCWRNKILCSEITFLPGANSWRPVRSSKLLLKREEVKFTVFFCSADFWSWDVWVQSWHDPRWRGRGRWRRTRRIQTTRRKFALETQINSCFPESVHSQWHLQTMDFPVQVHTPFSLLFSSLLPSGKALPVSVGRWREWKRRGVFWSDSRNQSGGSGRTGNGSW